ncbi:hypothetical protein ACLKA6_013079 [Drosophila palustris]
MHCGNLLFSIVCFVGWIAAFDVDKTALTVNVKGSEITVTVPGDRELISVFFSTELSDECTSGYSFVHNFNNSSSLNYKQDIKKEIKNDDEIRILGVFQTNDQVIRKTYDFKIDAQGNGIKQEILENAELELKILMIHSPNGTMRYDRGSQNPLHIRNLWPIFPLQKDCTSKQRERGSHEAECGGYRYYPNVAVPPVYTAKLHTKDLFSFKYGRVEIRARFPIGDWLFPYLIIQPTSSNSEDKWVNHLRIAYARGNINLQDKNVAEIGGETVFGSAVVLWPGKEKFTEYKNPLPNFPGHHFGNDFHNYTMIWRKDRIIFKVDGLTYNTITDEDILDEFNKQACFIVLGLTVGGAVNFPDDEILKSQKFFDNSDAKVVFQFRENLNLTTWTQPNLAIDHVHVYTIHENEN